MCKRVMLVAAIVLVSTGVAGTGRAQDLATVRGYLDPNDDAHWSWGETNAARVELIGRAAANANWFNHMRDIVENSEEETLDIVSLTFPANSTGLQHRHEIAKSIARNVLGKRVACNLERRPGAKRLHVRWVFGQRYEGGASAFYGTAEEEMAPYIARSFLEQLWSEYRNFCPGAFPRDNQVGARLSDAVQMGVVYAVTIGITSVAGANWNHSKIISNGRRALVGGTNMYRDYIVPADPTTLEIHDTDLKVEGPPAKFSSQWVDSLFWDYIMRAEIPAHDYGRITWDNCGPLTGRSGVRRCSRGGGTWIDGIGEVFDNGGFQGLIVHTNADTDVSACWWKGKKFPGLEHQDPWQSPWYSGGHKLPTPTAAAPSPATTILSAGQRGNWFKKPPTPTKIADSYDRAIGALIWSARQGTPGVPGAQIMIAQQEFRNKFSNVENNYVTSGSWQRYKLADRIAWELNNHVNWQTLRVRFLKSADPGPEETFGDGYNWYPVWKVVDSVWRDVMQRLSVRYETTWGHSFWSSRRRQRVGWSDADIRRNFCRIFEAKRFVAGGLFTRHHSKMVLVWNDAAGAAAASVGSLNYYNALMMHDYGNIVFQPTSGATVSALKQRFDADWAVAAYPLHTNDSNPKHCEWQCVAGQPCVLFGPRYTDTTQVLRPGDGEELAPLAVEAADEPLDVAEDGGGCAVAGGSRRGGTPWWPLAVVVAAWVAVRRRGAVAALLACAACGSSGPARPDDVGSAAWPSAADRAPIARVLLEPRLPASLGPALVPLTMDRDGPRTARVRYCHTAASLDAAATEVTAALAGKGWTGLTAERVAGRPDVRVVGRNGRFTLLGMVQEAPTPACEARDGKRSVTLVFASRAR